MSETEFVWGRRGLSARPLKGAVVALGAFDGVHLGHQKLLETVKAEARARGLPSVVIIFEPQPNEFFNADKAPARLTRLREKVVALRALDIDRVLCLKFDQVLRSYSAAQFVDELLVQGLGLKHLVVGDDFRFGANREGDYDYLQGRGRECGFDVSDTESLLAGDERISSTLIRKYLAQAQFIQVSELLGRPYTTIGRVAYGQQLGRTLGFPTMNIGLGRRVSPLSGVFAVNVSLRDVRYRGVANVGVRPTAQRLKKPTLEVHLLDTDVDAYGKFVTVEYIDKIRDEQKFETLDELKKRIALDVEQARALFARHQQDK